MTNIPSPYSNTPKFSIDDMREVWYIAVIHGATYWQYSQEKKHNLPECFNKAVLEILNDIKDADTLKQLLNNQGLSLGLYDEKIKNLSNSTTIDKKKKVSKRK